MNFFNIFSKNEIPQLKTKKHEALMPCDSHEFNCVEIVFREGYSIKYHGSKICIGNDTSINPSKESLKNVLENPHLFIRIIDYVNGSLTTQKTIDKIWSIEIDDILIKGKSIVQSPYNSSDDAVWVYINS